MKNKGFTLVELLVVISIVAILATVGIAVFAGAQKNARDAKRISDINSISKSLESSKDYSTGIYSNNFVADFPNEINGVPQDPKSPYTYCVALSTNKTTFTAPINWPVDGACPLDNNQWSTLTKDNITNNTKSWMVCARKEVSGTAFCVHSLEKQ